MKVLLAFADREPLLMLKTIAESSGMHPAKAHRYLVSLCRAGFVDRDVESNRYRLGHAVLRLGLTVMSGLRVVQVARPMLKAIRDDLEETMVLAVWGPQGATAMLVEQAEGPIAVTASVGSILPLLSSSSGRAFGAWLPRTTTAELLDRELRQAAKARLTGVPRNRQEAEKLFVEIRAHGLARVTGQLRPGVSSLTAPVFDHSGRIAAALSAVGAADYLDTDWDSELATKLRAAAASISRSLGYQTLPMQVAALANKAAA